MKTFYLGRTWQSWVVVIAILLLADLAVGWHRAWWIYALLGAVTFIATPKDLVFRTRR